MKVDFLDFTLEELDALEVATGRPFHELWGSGRAQDTQAILLAYVRRDHGAEEAKAIVRGMTMAEIAAAVTATDESLPVTYKDGIPSDGGRTIDRYIVAFAKRFSWPPSVTRQQTLRDLHLITESSIGEQP